MPDKGTEEQKKHVPLAIGVQWHVCLPETDVIYSCEECPLDECAYCALRTVTVLRKGEYHELNNTCKHKKMMVLQHQSNNRLWPKLATSDTSNGQAHASFEDTSYSFIFEPTPRVRNICDRSVRQQNIRGKHSTRSPQRINAARLSSFITSLSSN